MVQVVNNGAGVKRCLSSVQGQEVWELAQPGMLEDKMICKMIDVRCAIDESGAGEDIGIYWWRVGNLRGIGGHWQMWWAEL